MDPKLAKWIKWLETIKDEVGELVRAKHMFREVRNMIAANPTLQGHNSYYRYLAGSYASYAIIGVRRQLKIDKQSISFARLLNEISESPELLSRNYYVSLYQGSSVKDLANDDFNQYADPGAAHICGSMPKQDLADLRQQAEKCEEYADKRIAHRDKREPKQPPTFSEVDACVDHLDALYVKYFGLFHASHMDTLLPVWQYDWTEIFRTPWLQPAS